MLTDSGKVKPIGRAGRLSRCAVAVRQLDPLPVRRLPAAGALAAI
jgi:hypothetical protein